MRLFSLPLASAVAGAAFGALAVLVTIQPAALADSHGDAPKAKRIGMVIGLKPDQMAEYKRLHADDYAGVRDLLTKANMRNFSIFLHEMDDGLPYLFGYYEYVGADFEADMAWLDEQPRNKAWLEVTDAMQSPLKGETGWATMQEVYHND